MTRKMFLIDLSTLPIIGQVTYGDSFEFFPLFDAIFLSFAFYRDLLKINSEP